MEHCSYARAALEALAVPVVRAAIAERAVPAALAVLGRVAPVVWVWRASVARVAVAARAALAGMQVVSPTDQLVVMPALVAPVEWVALLARWAPTLRRCSAGLAVSAVTLARRARAPKA